MPFAITWMNLENIMLSELNERENMPGITYMWNVKKKKKLNS